MQADYVLGAVIGFLLGVLFMAWMSSGHSVMSVLRALWRFCDDRRASKRAEKIIARLQAAREEPIQRRPVPALWTDPPRLRFRKPVPTRDEPYSLERSQCAAEAASAIVKRMQEYQ